jgi:hypothetical protein
VLKGFLAEFNTLAQPAVGGRRGEASSAHIFFYIQGRRGHARVALQPAARENGVPDQPHEPRLRDRAQAFGHAVHAAVNGVVQRPVVMLGEQLRGELPARGDADLLEDRLEVVADRVAREEQGRRDLVRAEAARL